MDRLEETITGHYQKLAIGLVIGALFIGGLLLFLWQYSSVLSGMSQQAVKNPLQQNAISLTKAKEDYEAAFTTIMASYLGVEASSSDFASLTTRTKEQVLDLRVPASYKDLHLSTVLILSDVESLVAKGELDQARARISDLKKLDGELLSAVK